MIDLHVHSTCSGDGASSLAAQAQRAVELGLAEVGFCEHADFDPRDEGYGTLDLARYDWDLAAARAALTQPGLHLRQGVEISYQATREAEIRDWLAAHPWDYVIVSVHILDYDDGWAIVSEPHTAADYYRTHTARQAYLPYFHELHRAACSGLGDVIGHFDLVKRYGTTAYGPFDPTLYEEEIRAVLRAMVEAGVALEINTSGQRQSPGEPYPGLAVLRWYRQLGGELLTAGSDAHHISHLAAGLPQVLDLARAAGFRALTTFEARRPRYIPL